MLSDPSDNPVARMRVKRRDALLRQITEGSSSGSDRQLFQYSGTDVT